MSWAAHAARMGKTRNSCRNLVGRPEGKTYSENLDVAGKIILQWVLGKRWGKWGLDASGSGQGSMAEPCEHGTVPSGYIKCGEFLDQLSDC